LTEESERLAEEVVEAEALRRSDALKTALLRAVSHDLRSPLTAILASADALASSGLTLEPEDRLGLAETIRGEATRLDRVVEQLLDLSRLEAGAAEPHRELWHVDELVGQALAGLGAEAGRVRLEIGSETPPVEVDAAQVERVLANLLDNALQYSPRGSHVLLRAEPGATELRIHVVDSGAGLPAGRGRRRCARRDRREPARRRRARSRVARRQRHRRHARAPHLERRARDRPLRRRRRGREGRRARRRRRRLRDETVQRRRAARPAPRGTATRGCSGRTGCRDRRAANRPRETRRLGRRQGRAAHAARVRAPACARAESRQAADTLDAPARGVGERLRRRVALPPRLRL